MNPIIVAEGLTRRFGQQMAVNDLDLVVNEGEVFGFLGPNGAGKTTTVRLLNGVLTASAGRATVLGWDVATRGNEVRRFTGVLTENPSLYDGLSARDNLSVFGALYGVPEGKLPRLVDEFLDEFSLSERAGDRVGTYSKGMKQRLAIARAFLHAPPLLFLDEPTAGLDPEAARMVTGLIQQLSRRDGRTVFLCTHNLAEAQRLCDRVGVINRGVLRAIGTPRQLARQLWRGTFVEVDLQGEPSVQVAGLLGRMTEVCSCRMEDGKLVLELTDEDAIPDVVAAISSAGGRIHGVMPREHTLEEIYFEIQENGSRHSPAAARI